MNDINLIWHNLKDYLKNIFAEHIYNLGTANAQPISFTNNTLTIAVKNDTEQKIWHNVLIGSARDFLTNYAPHAELIIIREDSILKEPSVGESHYTVETYAPMNLNKQFTFDNFVVGGGNIMAHAAALAVSESLGTVYNPLFIYGGSGLGKTHLMHAIGNAVLSQNKQAIVHYVTSEDFVNEFTTAIRNGAMERFKNKYRRVDLLLVDDIQFLAGKEQTLDEFFHTFNTLHSANKQIVLTSDRLASEIPQLPDRLVSRFASGLSSDITPPDLETRTAILRKKANSLNLDIQDDTIAYIAGHVNSNVRELEAALTRVDFYALTKRSAITTSLAAEALQSLTVDTKKVTSIYDIQYEVSKLFNVSVEQLCGKKRSKDIVIPRQIAMYLAKEVTANSLSKIAHEFGGRDHTTVIHACDKIKNIVQNNSDSDVIYALEQLKHKF